MGGPDGAESRAAAAGDEGAFGGGDAGEGGAVAAMGEGQADAEQTGFGHRSPNVRRHTGAEAAPGDMAAGEGEAEVFWFAH